jgi:hypothetical protein
MRRRTYCSRTLHLFMFLLQKYLYVICKYCYNTEIPIDTSKEVGLLVYVNAEKTEYMLMLRHQNAGQNHDIMITNRSFENVAQFKILGTSVKSKFNSGRN